ncbi:2,3-dihydroxyphenylpropionate 1,2-dioxygenase [Litorimonas taeanensis]|uniref:2,3-dihydroxyphenylpropionate 1,2-dioxygenase n=1 Tax=Litorimonas taeanensis TaxID=568099 RepID=A0A420WJH3_9PROT|nr:catechol 1,2-dioxygenase [Litorimonas taeanensis]RKQ71181.1 2,3-dihydroxyphenylpropionate 1,2-dioxygenase [Litorimonas taeanensis]
MAKIIMGIGASHTTLMNTQWAKVDHLPEAHNFKNALHQASAAMHALKPDLAIVVGSNHFRGHWLDMMSSFAIGVDEIESSGEHGTPKGAQKTSPDNALTIANSLLDQGYDMAFSTRFVIDHGISHAIQYLTLENQIPIVPIMINSFAPPLPRLERCLTLGKAIRIAVETLPDDMTVAIIASGGLSHQLPFPDWRKPKSDNDDFLVDSWKNGRGDWERYEKRRRAIIVNAPPRLNEEFDETFLQALCDGKTEDWLKTISEDTLVETAGNGANELRNWIVMHSAINFATGKTLAYSPMPDWLTGMGVFICEPN